MTWDEVANEIEAALPAVFDKMHRANIAGDFELGTYLEQFAVVWAVKMQEARAMARREQKGTEANGIGAEGLSRGVRQTGAGGIRAKQKRF